MPKPETDHFDRETRVFCQYLISRPPDDYVLTCYRRAHEAGALYLHVHGNRFDDLLVRIARISPALTRLADVYASVFPGRRLRSKIVLLLAILEHSPAHYEHVSPAPRLSRGAFLPAAFATAVWYAMIVVAATFLILPLRLACGICGNSRRTSS